MARVSCIDRSYQISSVTVSFEEILDNLTYRAFLVFPLALLQPGASYRYYTWLGLVPALSTIFVTPYRIAIAECEASSKYSEILQLNVTNLRLPKNQVLIQG